MTGPMMRSVPPLWAALIAEGGWPDGCCAAILRPGELNATLPGMPHNVTTRMDLQLWSVAEAAGAHRELVVSTDPAELAGRLIGGELPEFGRRAFREEYGIRGSAAIDVGSPVGARTPPPCSPPWPVTCR